MGKFLFAVLIVGVLLAGCATVPPTPAQQRAEALFERCKQPGMTLIYVTPEGRARWQYGVDGASQSRAFTECWYQGGGWTQEREPSRPLPGR